jgi:hypothetical protein
MNHTLTLISILVLSGHAMAGLELQSVRCLSKDLTLDMAMVSSEASPGEKSPNGKAALVFTARSAAGRAILGQKQLIKTADIGTENWPSGSYIMSFGADGRMNLPLNSQEDVADMIKTARPLIYIYESKSGSLDGKVSVIAGKTVSWSRCDTDEDTADTVDAKSVQQYSSSSLSKLAVATAACPKPASDSEIKMILDQGPSAKKGTMSVCMNRIVAQSMALSGKSLRTANAQEVQDAISSLMTSAMKAELSNSQGAQ